MGDALPTAIVKPGDAGFGEGFYPPLAPGSGWSDYVDGNGFVVRVRYTSPHQTMYVGYMPPLSGPGRYNIEALIPGDVATTRGARYFIVSHPGGQRRETEVQIDQSYYHDAWVSLGVYDLDPAQPDSGRVNLIDATPDPEPRLIAFGAIRWRPVTQQEVVTQPTPEPPVGTPPPVLDEGFDAPIGSEAERASNIVWPPGWVDVNPIGNRYSLGYHTGADLNLRNGQDAHAPIFAIADGAVTNASRLKGSWGNVIVIDHRAAAGGTLVYARYAHVENMQVNAGAQVKRGQKIAQIGLFPGSTNNYHLHFDISTTTLLRDAPSDWPGENLGKVRQHYTDPKEFIRNHRPKR